jgi:single-stranded-DNA-specific exonuclease
VHSDTFHEGVIGLVAGKLMETFAKPAIVIARGATSSKGSARSVPGVNITDLLRQLKNQLLDVGGHPMAAGFSVATQNLENFVSLLRALGKKTIDTSLLVKSLHVECEISANCIDTKTIESLQSLEPYGSGNVVPVFVVRDLQITQQSIVGKDQRHRKLVLKRSDGTALQAMWFGGASHEIESLLNTPIEIAAILQFNEWNGKKSVQVLVKAVKQLL